MMTKTIGETREITNGASLALHEATTASITKRVLGDHPRRALLAQVLEEEGTSGAEEIRISDLRGQDPMEMGRPEVALEVEILITILSEEEGRLEEEDHQEVGRPGEEDHQEVGRSGEVSAEDLEDLRMERDEHHRGTWTGLS